jgi:hypothetical protein
MKRKNLSLQPSLFEELNQPPQVPPPAPKPIVGTNLGSSLKAWVEEQQQKQKPAPTRPRTEREEVIECIVRDKQTLEMDPVYWQPSRDFYLERIAAYQDWLAKL